MTMFRAVLLGCGILLLPASLSAGEKLVWKAGDKGSQGFWHQWPDKIYDGPIGFTAKEVDALEAATNELEAMTLAATGTLPMRLPHPFCVVSTCREQRCRRFPNLPGSTHALSASKWPSSASLPRFSSLPPTTSNMPSVLES